MRWNGLMVCGVAACAITMGAGQMRAQDAAPAAPAAPTTTPKELKVPLKNATGGDSGYVTFKTVKKGVKVTVHLENMTFGPHGVHVHEHAVCEGPDFKTAGGHFNPDGKHHGYMNMDGHHNGDMPSNVNVGEDHKGETSFVLTSISLDRSAPNSLVLNGGTSVVVHEHADDEKTDPSGNSGNRVACGVIQY
jgi:superoxide dismutase, Cu-Zn family